MEVKSAVFTKTLICTKSSCIIFFTKMSRYSHYTYCLQKELAHGGVKVLTHFFGLEVLGQFCIENQNRKITNLTKIF